MTKYFFDEIMKLDNTDSDISIFNTLNKLSKFAEISLVTDENNNILYRCNIDDIINSNITNEDLIYIRNGGWEKNGNYLIKYI